MTEQIRAELTAAATGQVNTAAAEIYERFFVPALFAQFAGPVCEAAGVAPGRRVLDVACGTGIVARTAAGRAGADAVTGVDRNAGMLAVARRVAPEIDWREGRAEALDFADASFDAVACQFALMFFEDRVAALREMRRVTRPGGRAVVAVWNAAETSPGYAAMIDLLDRLFGGEAADALRAPFLLGDRAIFGELLRQGGWAAASVETRPGTARFASLVEWVRTDVRGWTLAEMIDDAAAAELERAAAVELARFAGPDGRVAFEAPAHLATLEVG